MRIVMIESADLIKYTYGYDGIGHVSGIFLLNHA